MKISVIALVAVMSASTMTLAQSGAGAGAKQQIVGTWRLVSIEDTTSDGKTGPAKEFGSNAKGYLMYEADGHMCAEIMKPERTLADAAHPTEKEKADAFDGFIAYCGTYDFNADETMVTHHPDVAWTPPWVGTVQQRPFRLEGDRLIIIPKLTQANLVKRVLTWERMK